MQDQTTTTTGPEPANAAAVVILMHGRGSSPADMQGLAHALALPSLRFITPAAPGGQWYPARFIEPIARNEPYLSTALANYERLVAGLVAAGVPAERIVVGGFSQGACLTAEYMIRHPRRYGAGVILTGGLIGPPGTKWPTQPALAGVPVYLSGSKIDEWVPFDRVEETERVLRESGALVTKRMFENRPHSVADEEVAAVRTILASLAARTTATARKVAAASQ